MPLLKFSIIAALIACTPLITISAAHAQDSCGQAIGDERMVEAVEYCNIYERQMAYRESRIKYRTQMDERREDFIAPQTKARQKHQKDLTALHGKRNHDNDIAGF